MKPLPLHPCLTVTMDKHVLQLHPKHTYPEPQGHIDCYFGFVAQLNELGRHVTYRYVE
jgi:hypothetical protein